MTTKLFAYRIQLFVLCLSLGIFIFQLEPIMASRGIATSTVVTVFSVIQVLSIFSTIFWGKLVHGSEKGYWVVRIGVAFRIVVIGLMCLHVENTIFIALAILYNTVSGSVDIANEAQLLKWSAEEHQNFGRIRMFASFGFSISGLVSSALLKVTDTIDSVIVFALIINLVFMVTSFYRPVKIKPIQDHKKVAFKLDFSIILMMFLILITLALPNSFGIIMNLHFREELGTTLSTAVFLSGISILFSAGVSEVTAFWFIDRVINKIGARKTILIGMSASIFRWMLAASFHSPWMFTLSFLFHGINFAFMYMGFMTIVKRRFGNDSIGKVMTIYSVISSITAAIITQSFNLIMKFSDTFMILKLFVIISVVLCVAFYLAFWKNPKYAENGKSLV
ncbi:MAG: major facilitator transporter [Bacillales bacterium]|nr:major facilitator transporter [Bacillales bacterium]